MSQPNFLIVGAAKSGTTSLYHYLKQHPNVFMPDFKEPQYFVRQEVAERLPKGVYDKAAYLALFQDATEKRIGEASVFYLFYYQRAIQNILSELGKDTKIVIILRNPVERCYSAYQYVSRNNVMETWSIEKALGQEQERMQANKQLTPMAYYQQMGLYTDAVKAYQSAFTDVHVMLYDDFKSDPKTSMKALGQFLSIKGLENIDSTTRYNVGGKQWKYPILKQLFVPNSGLKKIAKKVTGSPKWVRRLRASGEEDAVPMDSEMRSRLIKFYKEDVLKLEKILDRNLQMWLNESA